MGILDNQKDIVTVDIKAFDKIGIISDIHGNGSFLEEIIKEMLNQGVNRFLVLGDLFTDFQESTKIFSLFKKLEEQYPVDYCYGNRDIDFIEREKGNRDFWNINSTSGNMLLAYEELGKTGLEWLKKFPKSCLLRFPNGEKALAVHNIVLDEKQKKILNEQKVNIVFFGHSHRVYNNDNRENDGLWYINPGSIGLTEDGLSYGGTYGIMDVTEKDIQYQTHIYYASEEVKKAALESIDKKRDLLKSYWHLLLKLSLQTGRNMTTVYFKEIQRLTGLYHESVEERRKNGYYQPLSLEESLINGYCDSDINGNPLEYHKTFSYFSDNNVFEKQDIYTINPIKSNMKILNDPKNYSEAEKEIYNIALNNTIYYASVFEINGLGKSLVAENQKISYDHKR